MTTQEYIKAVEEENKSLIEVLNDALVVLREDCDDYQRMRVVTRIQNILNSPSIEPPAEKPKRYGCHCDLEPGQKPDECVIDTSPVWCVHATQLLRDGKTREDCPYWREVKEEG